MATMHVNALVLVCDGCAKRLLGGEIFDTPMDARGTAYGEGWRFPNKISSKTGHAVKATSDVCPDCLPGWKPQTLNQGHASYQRMDGSTR